MSFLFLKSNDSWYYERACAPSGVDEIRKMLNDPEWFKGIRKIIPLPKIDDLNITSLTNPEIAFLGSIIPDPASIFVMKNLPNTQFKGIKTQQQMLYNEDINEALYNQFGMTVSNPSVKFNDLGGFDAPKSDLTRTIRFVSNGIVQKSLTMFLGVSRSGKSYFAECLAGELDRRLIILDLGMIMCSTNPPKLLDDFFKYLETIDSYVLLIDEIEKAADPKSGAAMARVMIGKLLTIFNNLNSESGFNIKDNPVIATANDITTLLENNPEFINRFGLKYFVNYPLKDNFISVADSYLRKMKVSGVDGQMFFDYSKNEYYMLEVPTMTSAGTTYGLFASGEIKEFVANLMLFCEDRDGSLWGNEQILQQVLKMQKPQLKYANAGVMKTIEAARLASFREVN